MKVKLYFALLATIAVIISSCKKDPETPSVVENSKVYIAGYLSMSACLWVDGVPEILSESGHSARAYGMEISGDDIYVCGYESNYAVYWKNGTRVRLSDGTSTTRAEKILVSDTSVYVIGYQELDYWTTLPKLWINGVDVPLSTVDNGRTTDVFVSGTDVYVLGYENTSLHHYRPILWKNGNAEYLTDGSKSTVLGSILVKGNDVYFAGEEMDDYYNGTAFYLKNSVKTYLPCDGSDSHTRGIFFADDTLYIGGTYRDQTTHNIKPAYWKNGVIQSLGHSDDFDCYFCSFFLYNHDMYATGQGYDMGSNDKAIYCKNDQFSILNDSTKSAIGYDIMVK